MAFKSSSVVWLLALLFIGLLNSAYGATNNGRKVASLRLRDRLGRRLLTTTTAKPGKKNKQDDPEKPEKPESPKKPESGGQTEAECAKNLCKDSKKDKKQCEAMAFECTKTLKDSAKKLKKKPEEIAKNLRQVLDSFSDKGEKIKTLETAVKGATKQCDMNSFVKEMQELGKKYKGKKDKKIPGEIAKLKSYGKMNTCLESVWDAVSKLKTDLKGKDPQESGTPETPKKPKKTEPEIKPKIDLERRLLGPLARRGFRPAVAFSFGWGAASGAVVGQSVSVLIAANRRPTFYYSANLGGEPSFGFSAGFGISLLRDYQRFQGRSLTGALGANAGIVGGNVGVIMTEENQSYQWDGLTMGIQAGLNAAPPVTISVTESNTELLGDDQNQDNAPEQEQENDDDDDADQDGQDGKEIWFSCFVFAFGGFSAGHLLRWSFSDSPEDTYKEVV